MLEMYRFAHTIAVSATPDRRYRAEVERETMARLRALQHDLIDEGCDEVLAGLFAMKQFRDECHLQHVYPSRATVRHRWSLVRDTIRGNNRLRMALLASLGALASMLAVAVAAVAASP